MSIVGPGGLEIASLRRRTVGRLIDAGAFAIPTLLAGGAVGGLFFAYDRWRGGNGELPFGGHGLDVFGHFGQSSAWRVGFTLAWVPIDLRMRNRRSLGDRAMGLRRVDARTGGPVSVRSVIVQSAVKAAASEANWLVLGPSQRRFEERRRVVLAEVNEARRYHEGDPEAQQRAMIEVWRSHGLSPWGWCSRGSLGLVSFNLPALWAPRNQSLPEWIAGIVTVRDSRA